MVTRQDIVKEALTWEGVPWKHQGRSTVGIDCVGLPVVVGEALGLIDIKLPVNYPKRPDGSFLSYFKEHLDKVPVKSLQPGDIVVFSGVDHMHVCHCGIVAEKHGQLSVIHAHATRRKVIHERLEEAKSVVGRPLHAFQYRGID